MMDSKQLEQVTRLVEQHTAWAQKWHRWQAMATSGIGYYLLWHNVNFGWETYWPRFHRLQAYAFAKMKECLRQEKMIENKIMAICKEGA